MGVGVSNPIFAKVSHKLARRPNAPKELLDINVLLKFMIGTHGVHYAAGPILLFEKGSCRFKSRTMFSLYTEVKTYNYALEMLVGPFDQDIRL
mgnify:CR=1 FL=1